MRIGRYQTDLGARRPIKHPRRNFQPTVRIGINKVAPKHHSIRLVDSLMNRDRKTRPRMKAVEQFAKLGPVGVLKLRCTTRSERTYRCRRTRRFGVMCAEQGACVRRRSWAGYFNMFEFEFPTGTTESKGSA